MKSDSFWALVGKEGGEAVADAWIEKLKGDKTNIMKSDSFLAFVGKENGEAAPAYFVDGLAERVRHRSWYFATYLLIFEAVLKN